MASEVVKEGNQIHESSSTKIHTSNFQKMQLQTFHHFLFHHMNTICTGLLYDMISFPNYSQP